MTVARLRPRRQPHYQNLIDIVAEYNRPRIALYSAAADRGPQQHLLVIVIIPLGRIIRIELLKPLPKCIISPASKKVSFYRLAFIAVSSGPFFQPESRFIQCTSRRTHSRCVGRDRSAVENSTIPSFPFEWGRNAGAAKEGKKTPLSDSRNRLQRFWPQVGLVH